MAINSKYLVGRTSNFGVQVDNKYETIVKGIDASINNVASTVDRSYIPGANPPIEEPIQAFRLIFNDIANANALVGDASNVTDWNTFFDLPTYGNPFTSVVIDGNQVKLYGGSNITLRNYLMDNNSSIIAINDDSGCIINATIGSFSYCSNLTTFSSLSITNLGDSCFAACLNLTTFNAPLLTIAGINCFTTCISLTTLNLPQLVTAGNNCFGYCTGLTTLNLPNLITAGLACFSDCTLLTVINLPACTNLGLTVGDDGVFNAIIGNIITLTIPASRMTCNSGNPDGDIQYLQTNNTVTVITV